MTQAVKTHFDVQDNAREFDLGAVFAAYYNAPLDQGSWDNSWDVLNHLMGVKLDGEAMLISISYCRPFLEEIIPDLDGELTASLKRLHRTKEIREIENHSDEEKELIADWVKKQVAIYGEKVVVQALNDEQKSGFIDHYVQAINTRYNNSLSDHEQSELRSNVIEWAYSSGLFQKDVREVIELRKNQI